MKYEKEFRNAKPETVGEKNKTVDLDNYMYWLEVEYGALKKVENLGLGNVRHSTLLKSSRSL